MRRGDVVTVAISGDFGKPRPALIVQADAFAETGTIAVLLISSTLVDAPLLRPDLAPATENGLIQPSQVMVDKIMAVKRERIGAVIGRVDDETLLTVTRSMAVFLGMG
ncbi:type II toxin-antitoxin system PemK/MazF family toxin [Rhizobium sp. 18065]|uniref:type II toxin-antitoxin system PemK/MazF family toxin n=1 Tax=Rhizobium sp. 18065 TaxID=2681411 RepID=UPI001356A9D0|nr:type II toxin-antitoxin system PemK/MazF family toxin [Rhizobium sp. 18065]